MNKTHQFRKAEKRITSDKELTSKSKMRNKDKHEKKSERFEAIKKTV